LNPVVSVCVQTYNHKDYIGQCLDGILMQKTTFPFEIVLGEDQSNDGTREVCLEYAEKFPNKIRLFLRKREDVIFKNGRPTGRFNLIQNLKAAHGKYIALCEGDDYWIDPLKLQKQVDILDNNPEYVVCHHWQKYGVLKEGNWIEIDAPTEGQGYFPRKQATVKDIFFNCVRIKSRTMIFRNIIDDEFLPDWFKKTAFGDVPLNFLLGKHGDFYFIDEPMAVYRQTNVGASTSGKNELGINRFIVEHFKNWIEIWDFANEHYSYKYNTEAMQTVLQFYSKMVENSQTSLSAVISLFWYNFKGRNVPVGKSLKGFMWLCLYYFKIVRKRINRKVLNR
jgi:glycosyltransferase involved in cell wall biosynthesis